VITKEQLKEAFDLLAELIDSWNDAAADDDRGRDNKVLCLTIWDDGSGRLGTVWQHVGEMNTTCEFDNTDELVAYLNRWMRLESSEVPDRKLTAEQYLKQFSPVQRLEALRRHIPDDWSDGPSDEEILGPEGWRQVPPVWLEPFEQPGMVTLAEIRESGGFADKVARGNVVTKAHHGNGAKL
jgi:hypothetical protein